MEKHLLFWKSTFLKCAEQSWQPFSMLMVVQLSQIQNSAVHVAHRILPRGPDQSFSTLPKHYYGLGTL